MVESLGRPFIVLVKVLVLLWAVVSDLSVYCWNALKRRIANGGPAYVLRWREETALVTGGMHSTY